MKPVAAWQRNGNLVSPRLTGRHLESHETQLPDPLTEFPTGLQCLFDFEELNCRIFGERFEVPPMAKDALRAAKAMVCHKSGKKKATWFDPARSPNYW
jgi:hypothetical protein